MKKILTISYYADFSRFFEVALDPILDKKCTWINLCIYPSSYIYSRIHKHDCVFLPQSVNNYVGEKKELDELELKKLSKYHGDSKKIIDKTQKYLSYYDNLLDKEKPDLIILSGDSRIPVTTLAYIAKERKIKTIYFEQGPINTTILDSKGVNANCSFRHSNEINNQSKRFEEAKKTRIKKWTGYKKYRLIDIFYAFLSSKNNPEISKYKLPRIQQKISRTPAPRNTSYALLILQVPEDANMILHSPYFKDHCTIVKAVYNALKLSLPEHNLIVREHPLYIGKYEKPLYDFITENKDIYLDPKSNLIELIRSSELVFVNNSTVGLEVMSIGKPLIVLGDSYYDNNLYTNKYYGHDLDRLILSSLNDIEKINLAKKRVNYLFNDIFITGHFRDLDTSRFIKISEIIKNEIY
ncbi:hypothetical protein [Providencia alcalifaciens]|uniref:WpaF n=1 Tax=Providencia alcalifaciens TaxID=126385 RepID=F8RBZ1_9GAMM|nr:hypothetical protein [Providencia alcalifaciens]AEB61498.1 WpaF [Providencia alcalifaciens]MBG5883988.1 hypothetical protein [Providencia alcalifaciens]